MSCCGAPPDSPRRPHVPPAPTTQDESVLPPAILARKPSMRPASLSVSHSVDHADGPTSLRQVELTLSNSPTSLARRESASPARGRSGSVTTPRPRSKSASRKTLEERERDVERMEAIQAAERQRLSEEKDRLTAIAQQLQLASQRVRTQWLEHHKDSDSKTTASAAGRTPADTATHDLVTATVTSLAAVSPHAPMPAAVALPRSQLMEMREWTSLNKPPLSRTRSESAGSALRTPMQRSASVVASTTTTTTPHANALNSASKLPKIPERTISLAAITTSASPASSTAHAAAAATPVSGASDTRHLAPRTITPVRTRSDTSPNIYTTPVMQQQQQQQGTPATGGALTSKASRKKSGVQRLRSTSIARVGSKGYIPPPLADMSTGSFHSASSQVCC
eukprot:TRINITY_DN9516_c0_g1_i3.p1 TRINITY_DN9516_c0_g1~~TRINITY_DN9516_c0_g1_i3.p1  ORF type:complete len:395 (-),score=83.81 TRINITY_DN9516_c0_g1_i3:76-1260(-)